MKKTVALLSLLFLLITARAEEEVKWVEKDAWSYDDKEKAMVKVRIASPEAPDYAGFFMESWSDPVVTIRGIQMDDSKPKQWDPQDVTVPKELLKAALPKDDALLEYRTITSDPFHQGVFPLYQWVNTVFLLLPQKDKESVPLDPKHEYQGITCEACALTPKNGELPLLYRRTIDPAKNLAGEFMGLLNLQTGRVTEILKLESTLSVSQIAWLGDHRVVLVGGKRHTKDWMVVDLKEKKIVSSGYHTAGIEWLIDKQEFLVWVRSPSALKMFSAPKE